MHKHNKDEPEDHLKEQQSIELKVNKKFEVLDTLIKHNKYNKQLIKNMEAIKKTTFKVTSLTTLKMNF